MSSENAEGKGDVGGGEVERTVSNQQTLDSIDDALGGIEAQLRPSMAGRRSVGTRSVAAGMGGGRSVRESIRTALRSLRSRLGTVEEEEPNGGRSAEDTATMNNISQRLRNAEIAHSNRIPLDVLQREMSRRQSAVSTAAEITQKEESEQAQHARPSTRRRSSVLLASRRMAEAAEGHQADMDLHGASMPTLSVETIAESTEEKGDEGGEVVVTADDYKMESQKEQESEDESENVEHELPILLTITSFSRLGPARKSVLFNGPERRPTLQPITSATVIYSWGSGVNSLHDNDDDKQVQDALVKPDSRVGARDIASISVGHHHAACCTSTGEVLICGRNTAGAVDPDRKEEDVIARPVLLESLSMSRIVQVSCGLDHTAAVRSNGTVLTWGSNEYGQLGHRLPFSRDGPPPASSLKFCRPKIMVLGAGSRASSVACGDSFTLVLTSRMGLLACGVEVISGRSKKEGEIRLPAPIPALEDLPLVAIAAGRRHAVAVTAHGSVFAWGENTHGSLGRGFPKATTVPVPIRVSTKISPPSGSDLPEPLSNWGFWDGGSGHVSLADDIAVIDAACGDEHTVLVTRSGRLLVCGSNSHGQLGLDPTASQAIDRAKPVDHPNAKLGRSFVSAEAGEAHTLLLDDAGDVWLLGGNAASKLECVFANKDVRWIAAGGSQSVAVAAATGRNLPNPEFSDEGADAATALTRGRSLEDLLSDLPEGKRPKDEKERPLGEVEVELAKRTQELLKTPAVLNGLFLDPTELDNLFQQLLSTDSLPFQQSIASAIERGMQQGLETVRSDDARLLYPEQVRFLLLYIQCPLFLNWKDSDVVFDCRGDLILLLCETILGVSYEGYKAFLSWATSIYSRELFTRFLVRPLIAQLEKCLSVAAGAERRPIPALVAVLRWLYNASERAGIALAEDFFCDAIGDSDPRWLVEDLFTLKSATKHQRAANFFICDNPFLFSPSTKRTLLEFESEMNMLRTAAKRMTYNEEEKTYEIEPFYVLEIERENLLSQTLGKIGKVEPYELRKKLRIVFKGEDGIDAGGVTREFFHLLSAELFDDSSGMWSESLAAEQITWFNSDCVWNDEGFYLVGILIGLAVYNSVLLDVHFPQAVYRKLLGESLGFEDLVDQEVKNGLQMLLDYEGDDVEDIFCLTFDVNWMDLGEEKRRELKPGGSNIPVTSNNKEEFVMLYVKWLLVDSINPQYEAFERGFMRVMEDSSLDLLRPEDLELLVVGSPELDFEALEGNTEYEGGYDSESAVIKCFWRFVKNASPETQLQLLRFTTGSAKAPIGGLGKQDFKIQRAGPDSMQLPSSHTCFNTLLLPDYGDNYEKLEERLGRAIIECEGFGLQ